MNAAKYKEVLEKILMQSERNLQLGRQTLDKKQLKHTEFTLTLKGLFRAVSKSNIQSTLIQCCWTVKYKNSSG